VRSVTARYEQNILKRSDGRSFSYFQSKGNLHHVETSI